MAVTKLVRVTIDVELEKDVQDLVDLVANRAHTIQGVANAYSVAVEEVIDGFKSQHDLTDLEAKAETLWSRIVAKVKGWFSRGD